MSQSYAIFPGSFDPPTYGHLDIIRRVSNMFDKVDVIVSTNPHKEYIFSKEERCALMQQYCKAYRNVQIVSWDGLIVHYAREHGINIIIRGIRPLSDFAYEFELATWNHQITPEIETLFMPTAPQYFVLRSSSLKELVALGVSLKDVAPLEVITLLNKKLGNNC